MRTYYYRNNQPHIQPIGGTFNITLMAHDAVSKAELCQIRKEREKRYAESYQLADDQIDRAKSGVQQWFEMEYDELLHRRRKQENPFINPIAAQAFMGVFFNITTTYIIFWQWL
ncbi:MAG: hypothetical protein AAF433_11725 [Bacteroidota bacterium]